MHLLHNVAADFVNGGR